MAETPMKLVIDCATGEKEYIPLSAEELAQQEIDRANAEAERLAQEKAQAKLEADKASALVKLTTLGLTEDEALALVGA